MRAASPNSRLAKARVLETANLMQMSQISFHRRDAETQRLRREVQVSWVMADRSVPTEHRDESKAVIATGIRSRAYQAVEKAVWQWFLCAELRASAALRW